MRISHFTADSDIQFARRIHSKMQILSCTEGHFSGWILDAAGIFYHRSMQRHKSALRLYLRRIQYLSCRRFTESQ